MKYLYIIIALSFSVNATSEEVIQMQALDKELASSLGFEISVSEDVGTLIVNLSGPSQLNNGCLASRSGNVLFAPDGEEVMVYITELNESNGTPKALGYITDQTFTFGIFIDYFCPNGRERESVRYTVLSISEWLITSQ